MSTSARKHLLATPGYMGRTTADRRAYREQQRAERKALDATPERRAEQQRIDDAHAALLRESVA